MTKTTKQFNLYDCTVTHIKIGQVNIYSANPK